MTSGPYFLNLSLKGAPSFRRLVPLSPKSVFSAVPRSFMKNTRSWAGSCLLAAACLALPGTGAGAADWKFSSSFNYDTGKYGGTTRTDSIYIPFTLKRYYREGDISVTLPCLRQSSSGRITRVGGKPVRATGGRVSARAAAESGLGDILVRGSYVLKREGPKSFDLAAAGKLKLPTANETRGLGTGEMDQGAGLEFAKELSPDLTMLADAYYTIIGDPPGADLNNEVALDLGFSRPVSKNLSLTVLYETSSALLDGNADPRSLSGTLSYAAAGGAEYSCGLLLGLSEGSPQLGLSAGFSRRF